MFNIEDKTKHQSTNNHAWSAEEKGKALFNTIYSRTIQINNFVSHNATTANFTRDERKLLQLKQLSLC
jgi:hypothetical protein